MSGRRASFAAAATGLEGTIERRKAAIPTVGASTGAETERLAASDRAASVGIGKTPSSAGTSTAAMAVDTQRSAMKVTTDRIATRSPSALSAVFAIPVMRRSEEHTSELQSLMRISYAVFCLQIHTERRT